MTFSILVRNEDGSELGAAAATGSLCVGGWVLRGRVKVGLSASQGAAPSTFWGERVLDELAAGRDCECAVAAVTRGDRGRDWRQLAALARSGPGAGWSGRRNTPAMHTAHFVGGIATGNMLRDEAVVEQLAAGYLASHGNVAERLLLALRAADAAGGDLRGLQSAALLVLREDRAPLTLRIDWHREPLTALERLYERASTGDYADWFARVPSLADPERGLS